MFKCLKTMFIVLFAMSQVMSSYRLVLANTFEVPPSAEGHTWPLLAQNDRSTALRDSSTVDVEPPLIEHDVIKEAEADIRQTFVATVVDDQDLDSVLFYYRYAGESSFSRYAMMPISSSSTYMAQIPTDPKSLKSIEYYIQARDTSGNRTVRGYTFSPLVRNIVPFTIEEAVTQAIPEKAVDSIETSSSSKLPKAVYVLGGVLLVGLIAAAAGSSGGEAGPDSECGSEGCRLTLNVDKPF